jgi:hypothetical protein
VVIVERSSIKISALRIAHRNFYGQSTQNYAERTWRKTSFSGDVHVGVATKVKLLSTQKLVHSNAEMLYT